jgi:hypothetical protein
MFIKQRTAVEKGVMVGFMEKDKDLQLEPIFRQRIWGSSRSAPAPRKRNSFDNVNDVPFGFGHQHKELEGTGKHSSRIPLDRVRGICCHPRNSGRIDTAGGDQECGVTFEGGVGLEERGSRTRAGKSLHFLVYYLHNTHYQT